MLNDRIVGLDRVTTVLKEISQQMKFANAINGLNEQMRQGCITKDEYNNRIECLYELMKIKW